MGFSDQQKSWPVPLSFLMLTGLSVTQISISTHSSLLEKGQIFLILSSENELIDYYQLK